MPWKVSTHVKERARFIEAWLEGEHPSMAALCIEFGISRKTGYKWVSRFKKGGFQGLHDRSKRFKRHPNTTPQEVVDIIVGARKRHPTWGPKKIHTWLERRGEQVPAVSTVGEILRREGMVVKRRRKPRPGEYSIFFAAKRFVMPMNSRAAKCSTKRSSSSDCPRRSAPTTARRSRRCTG